VQIDRAIMPRLARLAGQFPVLVLSGARQSGKTTVLRRV
jgi:predicted AAA+ superfamily ATPase